MKSRGVAIIGGGPAGIAAGRALSSLGIEFSLFEAGQALGDRRHDHAEDLGTGIGGAGLFSDGKFSFYPSGTHLYTLEDRARLQEAYTDIERLLHDVDIPVPKTFPADWHTGGADAPSLVAKAYPSTYGSLKQRNDLIATMIRDYGHRIRTCTHVRRIDPVDGGYRLVIDTAGQTTTSEVFDTILLATGRFGPRDLRNLLGDHAETEQQRYEFGIRIEHKNGAGFLSRINRPDVKLILEAAGCEVRTFCTCRDGEIWMIPYGQEAALSGRSDGPPSGYSNFGLLARFTGARTAAGHAMWERMQASLAPGETALWQPLGDFLANISALPDGDPRPQDRPWFPAAKFRHGNIAQRLHPDLYRILKAGITILTEHYPDLASADTMCLFPAIEGVGDFPACDANLRGRSGRLWYCGDVVGRFRGLVPALVSGHYAALAIAAGMGRSSEQADVPELQIIAAQ